MSFSGEVKEELSRRMAKGRHCQIAELAAIFLYHCRLSMEDTHGHRVRTPEELFSMNFEPGDILSKRYNSLTKSAFDIDTAKRMSADESLRIFGAFKLLDDTGTKILEDELGLRRCSGLLVKKECCKRAYIRGAFLAAGSISDPGKSYHFEIVCRTRPQAEQLRGLMADFGVEAGIVLRKKHYVVYLKDGEQIVDMLGVMGASVSLMNFENVRILKGISNSVNRKVNCETANINKTVSASVRQNQDIALIREHMGLEKLPENLRQMAYLRLEYPDATLKELGGLLSPPVGKSGVNHRLRKLSEIAEQLR